MIKPKHVIKINKYTGKIENPTLLLQNHSNRTIGKISHYNNWNCSLVGNGIDEFTFDVHKYYNGKRCPVWDDLVDLKLIEILDYGRFEIKVNYVDSNETIKSVHGQSLEIELSQLFLNDFHVNDEEATSIERTEFNINEFDENGKLIPTVFYNAYDTKHSLLHRALADKAPHWKIGYVTPYIALDEESQPEPSNKFQRTYTVDGQSIYDYFTQTVSKESNVIFLFDTLNRLVHCYSLCDCVDQKTGEILEHGIGTDTSILVSKRKLTNEISISSNKDSVKNCFRIKGGDDTINDLVRAVNVNGSNYIYQFADFQYNDMSDELVEKLKSYNQLVESKSEEYYGENGIYTKICNTYKDYLYYKSEMMPNVVITTTTAKEQYDILESKLKNSLIAVSSVNNFTGDAFVGITNNIEAIAQTMIDSRYEISVVNDSSSYNSSNKIWSGKFEIVRKIDETDIYTGSTTISVSVTDDELEFTKQKIQKALEKGDMLSVDLDISKSPYVNADGSLNKNKIKEYFNLYCLERLKSYKSGYESCLSILMTMGMGTDTDDEITHNYYQKYYDLKTIVENIFIERENKVNNLDKELNELYLKQSEFQKNIDFQNYLGSNLYLEFCTYRREDTYTNENYISEGLSHSESMEKAKELVEVATKELKKACVLQRTVSCTLNNLFALTEFEPLYDGFSLFNYIRIKTNDEIIKLRLIGVDFNGNDITSIVVTFSEQIECVDGKFKDTQSILQQASNMATSYNATTLQAKQGVEANENINNITQNGINTSKSILYNNDNNEVTMSGAGIICKKMEDQGIFSNKQLRIVGNGMYMTKDNWASVELAIGEIEMILPDGTRQRDYGLIADKIIGNMIIGNNVFVENTSRNVKITGDGIIITGGSISLKAFAQDAIDELDKANKTATDALDKAEDALNKTITKVDVMYALSSSSIVAPTSNWSTTAPQWQIGMYMWQKTITTYSDGHEVESKPTCITGAKGNDGIGITSIVEQYYLSSSNLTQTDGSWSINQPKWENGFYLWVRSYITWDDGSNTTSTPMLASAINSANENAYNAKTWTDENGVPLYNMIDKWVGDAKISGETLMQGGFIQTNTISVEHIIPKNYDDNISFINLQNGTFNFGNKLIWDSYKLTVKGTIYATDGEFTGTIISDSGSIGGWTIGDKALYNGTNSLNTTSNTQGLYLGTDGILSYNNSFQYVLISNGNIQANYGKIAGWNINNYAFYTDGATLTNTIGAYIGTDGIRLGKGFSVNEDGNALFNGNITGSTFESTENGNFSIDSDGTISAKNLSSSGAVYTDILYCNEISCDGYVKTLTSSVTLYVNANTGSDDNVCKKNAVFKTLQGAINSIPKFLNKRTVYIELQTDVVENVTVSYFSSGVIRVYLCGHTINGYFRIYNSSQVYLYGGTKSGDGIDLYGIIHPSTGISVGDIYTASIYASVNTSFLMYNIDVYGSDNLLKDTTTKLCIAAAYGGSIYASDINIINTDIGFRSSGCATIYVAKSSGIANTTCFYATSGGYLGLGDSTQAGGVKNNTNEAHGGTIKYHNCTFEKGNASESNETASTQKVEKTLIATSIGANSILDYGTNYAKWRSDNQPRVSDLEDGGWTSGNHMAFWFFGDAFEDIESQNVNKIEITYSRVAGGNSGEVTHYFYTHNYESQPSTVSPSKGVSIGSASLSINNSKTITITDSTIIANIKASKGICSLPPYQTRTYYSVLSGTMKVKFYYTE